MRFAAVPAGTVAAGSVLAVISAFLPGFSVPRSASWSQGTSYLSTADGKVVLGCAVVALVFLGGAWAVHRRGVLWGIYIAGVGAIALPAIILGTEFTLVGAGPNGTDVKASPAAGPYLALVGGLVLFAAAIAMRRTARPHGS